MRTLIYKRTHPGDPDETGWFGICDCMGKVRWWDFGAVIGVGGTGDEPKRHKLDGKVNWIGITPHKSGPADKRMRGPDVTFDRFRLFGSDGSGGPSFRKLAPNLADRMYSNSMHFLMNDLNPVEQREVEKVLALAKKASRSSAYPVGQVTISGKCTPRGPSAKSIKGCSR